MMGHAEAIASMAAWPAGYPNATANARVKEIFVQHAAAAKATQAPDGRWHQLLNDTDSFLETSVTAMFLTSIVRGVRDGILPKEDYALVRWRWRWRWRYRHRCCGTRICSIESSPSTTATTTARTPRSSLKVPPVRMGVTSPCVLRMHAVAGYGLSAPPTVVQAMLPPPRCSVGLDVLFAVASMTQPRYLVLGRIHHVRFAMPPNIPPPPPLSRPLPLL